MNLENIIPAVIALLSAVGAVWGSHKQLQKSLINLLDELRDELKKGD
jgi:hypothetical protein